MFGEENNVDYTFVNITSAGMFAILAKSKDEVKFGIKPKMREYVTKSGETKTIYEFTTNSLTGHLLKAKIRNTDFGDNITITLKVTQGETYYFSISAATNSIYGRTLLELLPNLNPNDYITIKVWDTFTSEGKSVYAGLKIVNGNEEKVRSFFWDYEKKTSLHGYPQMKKGMDKDDKKIYFLQAEKVAKNYFVEKVQPRFASAHPDHEENHQTTDEATDSFDLLTELQDQDVTNPFNDDDDLPF